MTYIPDCYLMGGCEACRAEMDIENYCPLDDPILQARMRVADELENAGMAAERRFQIRHPGGISPAATVLFSLANEFDPALPF